MKLSKKLAIALSFAVISTTAFALPFNSKISGDEAARLQNGEVLIRNIDVAKNISLQDGVNPLADKIIGIIRDLKPKYLAEVIQIKPYEGNEDLPEELEKLLLNVPEYAGIPYWSVRHEKYFDLYSSAEIKSQSSDNEKTNLQVELWMDPFETVKQSIDIYKQDNMILYTSKNTNNLLYNGKIQCVTANKMNMSILLFRDGDNWILYGIGGVNAAKIPFFDERIETSFINRIKTFCNFIFTKLDTTEA